MELLVPPETPVVLVVDDVAANRELLEGHLLELGYDVRQARDGLEALEVIDAEEPDLVLLDIDMPRMNGIELCRNLKAHPLRRLIPIVLVTALQDRVTRLQGLGAGADDFLTKPFDAKELLVRTKVLLRERAMNKRLDAAESVILAFARVVEARDLYTVHHAERVGRYAREVGRAHGLTEEECDVLHKGGILHDLGKIVIPEGILLKSGPLNDDEWAVMRRHSAEGTRICLPLRSTTRYLPIVRHHHESFDGTGYPDKLPGREIPLGARIVAVADAWDAMSSDRAYRRALPQEETLRRLREGAGRQWDPQFVEILLGLLDGGLAERMERLVQEQLGASATGAV